MTESRPGIVPVYQEYMNPILSILRREGRPLSIEHLDRLVISEMALPADVAAVPHDVEKPDRSEVEYRIAWSRTYLKKAGLLDNPERGQWAISEKGRAAGAIDAYELAARIGQAVKAAGSERATEGSLEEGDEQVEEASEDEELVAARVGTELARQLLETREELATAGQLLSAEHADRCHRRFRELFGPDVLGGLDGDALLTKMHGRGSKDSLVYWLEFKDDDDFPAQFGSIGGGSALKFGIYQASETGQWMTGSGRQQTRLTHEEAVVIARGQRDQLIAGTKILGALSPNTEAIDYSALQDAMAAAAPTVAESSWGHKYFALLFPAILAPIHGTGYQHRQIHKLLKLPGRGRYDNDRIFAGVARQLGMSLLDLAVTLHRRNGGLHGYWRVGTTIDGNSEWGRMRAGGFAAIGWDALGDLSTVSRDEASKQELRDRFERNYPGEPSTITRAVNQILQFAVGAQEGDLVVAMEGARVRGIGRIVGGYTFTPSDGPCPHRRGVDWLLTGDWKFPNTTVAVCAAAVAGRAC